MFNVLFFFLSLQVIYVMRNPKDVFTSSFHYYGITSFLVKPGPQNEFLQKFLDGKGLPHCSTYSRAIRLHFPMAQIVGRPWPVGRTFLCTITLILDVQLTQSFFSTFIFNTIHKSNSSWWLLLQVRTVNITSFWFYKLTFIAVNSFWLRQIKSTHHIFFHRADVIRHQAHGIALPIFSTLVFHVWYLSINNKISVSLLIMRKYLCFSFPYSYVWLMVWSC